MPANYGNSENCSEIEGFGMVKMTEKTDGSHDHEILAVGMRSSEAAATVKVVLITDLGQRQKSA